MERKEVTVNNILYEIIDNCLLRITEKDSVLEIPIKLINREKDCSSHCSLRRFQHCINTYTNSYPCTEIYSILGKILEKNEDFAFDINPKDFALAEKLIISSMKHKDGMILKKKISFKRYGL